MPADRIGGDSPQRDAAGFRRGHAQGEPGTGLIDERLESGGSAWFDFSKLCERHHDNLLVAIAIAGLAAGAILWWAGSSRQARLAWLIATTPVFLGLFVQIIASLRRRDIGLDIVAALSMSAAMAFGEALAGNVIALMYASGQLLENFAEGRAKKEMTALLGRVAHTAMRFHDQALVETPIAALAPGDRLLIQKGESCRSMVTSPVRSPCSICRR